MFECSANATRRSELFDNLRKVPGGAEKLRQPGQLYLAIVVGKERVSRLVSCGFWREVCRIFTPAIADYWQKAWSLRNSCKHGGEQWVFLLFIPLLKVRGVGPMAILLWHEW
jgi:hypothetical protein